jgi:hypothetical protein
VTPTAPIVFLDTETTGLDPDDEIWEFAAIRREVDGQQAAHRVLVQHNLAKAARLPESFRADHDSRYYPDFAVTLDDLTDLVCELTIDRPTIVGAVPNFDTERLARILHGRGRTPCWHHHLIDVENLAVGYLRGRVKFTPWGTGGDPQPAALAQLCAPPWDSEDLSRAVGVNPDRFERHTALGDCLWAMAIYDAVMGGTR